MLSQRVINGMRKRHVTNPDEHTSNGKRKLALARVDTIAADFAKMFGKDAVIRVDSTNESDLTLGGYSTGFQEIDDVLSGKTDEKGETIPGSGVGFPKGRMIEIFGPESSSKTSMCLCAIADCQRKGGIAAFIDAEHALDLSYARMLGVDVDALLIFQPDSAEEAKAYAKMLVEKGVNLVVIDSVAAMTPKKELETGKMNMGEQARIMSQACRQINSRLKAAWGAGGEAPPTVIWINQIRYKIGVMFGNPEMTSGGNALKFYASIRLDLRRIKVIMKQVKGRKVTQGVLIRAKTVKNKVVPPFREIVFKILFHGAERGVHVPSPEEMEKLLSRDKE